MTSSAVFPAKGHLKDLIEITGLNRTTEQDIRENLLFVKLYFSTLNYDEKIERKSFDQSTLVANIGGFLGLFLGASVVTLCEIVEVFCHIIMVGFRKTARLCQTHGSPDEEPK